MEPCLLTFLESLNSLDQYGPEVFFLITKYIPRSVFLCFDSYNNKDNYSTTNLEDMNIASYTVWFTSLYKHGRQKVLLLFQGGPNSLQLVFQVKRTCKPGQPSQNLASHQ